MPPKSLYKKCEFCIEMDSSTTMYLAGIEYDYNVPIFEHKQQHSQLLNTCIDVNMLSFIEKAYSKNIFTTQSCEGYKDCNTMRFEYPNFTYRIDDDDKVKEWFSTAGVEIEEILFKQFHYSIRYNGEFNQIFISNEVKEKLSSCR